MTDDVPMGMRRVELNLNLLATLELLLMEGSVSRTALRLGISQAAVSARLIKLRKHYGDDLFVVRGRQLVRTPFAESLVEPLAELIRQAREISSLRQAFVPETIERVFNIRAGDIDTFLLLACLSRKLEQLAPGVSLHIKAAPATQQDIDFSISPWGLHNHALASQTLYKDSYCVLLDRAHPCLGEVEAISEEQYLGHRHVVRHFGVTGSPSLEAMTMARLGYERQVGAIVDAYASIPFMLLGTRYLSTVPRRFAEEMMRMFPLKWLPLPFDFPQQTMLVQWHGHLSRDIVALWFKDLLIESAREIYPE